VTVSPLVPEGPLRPGLFELASFNVSPSDGFVEWLASENVSLALTMGNMLALIGRDREGGLRVATRPYPTAAGLATDGSRTFYLASGWQLIRFEDALLEGTRDAEGHDRLFMPQKAVTIGALVTYDIAVPATGAPLFTSALCNCVAMPSRRLNFTAVWKPPFVTDLVGEDRCHLTGLALDGAKLAYVTCAAESNVAGGWQDSLNSGGVVVDVEANDVLAKGISLPHSPRIHDGQLYVAAAGDGALLRVDRATGDREVVVQLPGLVRGLDFSGQFAVVGCSKVHEDGPYVGVPIGGLDATGQRNGVTVVDLRTGRAVHELIFEGASGEVFGVSLIRGAAHVGVAEGAGRGWEQLSIGDIEPATRPQGER
jgi:uncharacterized protein (TIGR03032 family)